MSNKRSEATLNGKQYSWNANQNNPLCINHDNLRYVYNVRDEEIRQKYIDTVQYAIDHHQLKNETDIVIKYLKTWFPDFGKKQMKGARIDKDKRQSIITLHENNHSVDDIAKRTNISLTSIKRILKQHEMGLEDDSYYSNDPGSIELRNFITTFNKFAKEWKESGFAKEWLGWDGKNASASKYVAELLEVSERVINAWAQGAIRPSKANKDKLADKLGIEWDGPKAVQKIKLIGK